MTGYGVSRSNSVEFAPVHAGHVAGELGDGDLHAEADAEERDPALAGHPRGRGSCPRCRGRRSRRG